jgi:hypothetical protein
VSKNVGLCGHCSVSAMPLNLRRSPQTFGEPIFGQPAISWNL